MFIISCRRFPALLLTFWISIYSLHTSASILSDITCAALVSGVSTGQCVSEFKESYTAFNSVGEIPKYYICCSANLLKSCLQDQVTEKCGASAKGFATILSSTVINTINDVAGKPVRCNWEAWYFDRNSPVCWRIVAQGIGGIAQLLRI